MTSLIGQKAPLLSVSEWVQGEPTNFDQLLGRVVLVEVFQVNCPGCFLYALPQAISVFHQFHSQGLTVLGVATAFEDFDKNNLENLVYLIKYGSVFGETQRMLSQRGELVNNKLAYQIPFPVALDRLHKNLNAVTPEAISIFIDEHIPNFRQLNESQQNVTRQQVDRYLNALEYRAETFENFALKGTPSHILVDKQGILRGTTFGEHRNLETKIIELLGETFVPASHQDS